MEQMTRPLSILLIAWAIVAAGCGSDTGNNTLMPNVTGSNGEVLLVMNNATWQDTAGRQIEDILTHLYPGLPQGEPYFDVSRIEHDAFGKIFRTNRNIVHVEVGPDIEPKFAYKRDVWAYPQAVVELKANSREQLLKMLQGRGKKIRKFFHDTEIQRLLTRNKRYMENTVSEKLVNNHQINIIVPKGYRMATDTAHFAWINHETPQNYQGIFVYYEDYLDTSDFKRGHILAMRDKYLKKYVPGPSPNSYMTTDHKTPLQDTIIDFKGMYTRKIYGLWRVEGDFMGGPFLSYTFVDEHRNRLVTVEGWVYAPKYNKRNYMRTMEAILRSVELEVPEHLAEEEAGGQ